jgi:putative DNA primase/helicase
MVDKPEGYKEKVLRPILVSDNISEMVDAIQAAIIEAKLPVLRRSNVLVEPLYETRPIRKGSPEKTQVTILRRLDASQLRMLVTKHAAFFEKQNKSGKVRVMAPLEPFNTLIGLGHYAFPNVAGVIDAPTMRPDGTILADSGYDEATGLWHYKDPHLGIVEVPKKPTRKQAQAALDKLKALLAEFPFADPRLDISVALAAILTVVARGAFPHSVAFMVTAFAAGSGKGYLVELITTIARGRKVVPISVGDGEVEFEKRLSVALMEGHSIVSVDNCAQGQEVGGDFLCTLIAEGCAAPRILGKSEMPQCDWNGTFFINGNNIAYRGDMVRRGLIINLDAKMERPETKVYSGRPVDLVIKNRAEYIAAALTVVRAAFVSEEAQSLNLSPLNGFEGWSQFVRRPLVWLNEQDPIDCIEKVRAVSSTYRDTAAILAVADRLMVTKKGKGRGWRSVELLKTISNLGLETEERELFESAFPGRGGGIDSVAFGKWLGKIRGGIYGGRRLDWDPDQGGASVNKGRLWIIAEAPA